MNPDWDDNDGGESFWAIWIILLILILSFLPSPDTIQSYLCRIAYSTCPISKDTLMLIIVSSITLLAWFVNSQRKKIKKRRWEELNKHIEYVVMEKLREIEEEKDE